jgi:hypothetical protein
MTGFFPKNYGQGAPPAGDMMPPAGGMSPMAGGMAPEAGGLPPSTQDARNMVSQPTEPDDMRARAEEIIAKARTQGPESITPEEFAFLKMFLGSAPTEDSEGVFGESQGQGAPSGVVNTPDAMYGGDPISTPVGRAPPPHGGTGTNMMGGVRQPPIPLHKIMK